MRGTSLSRRQGDDFRFYKYLQGTVPEGSSLGEVVNGEKVGSCQFIGERREQNAQGDRTAEVAAELWSQYSPSTDVRGKKSRGSRVTHVCKESGPPGPCKDHCLPTTGSPFFSRRLPFSSHPVVASRLYERPEEVTGETQNKDQANSTCGSLLSVC
jgi:hypothetical protein